MRALGFWVIAALCLAGCDPAPKIDQAARDSADLEKSFGPSKPILEGDWISLGSVKGSVLHVYELYTVGGDQTFVPPPGSAYIDVVYAFKTPTNQSVSLCNPPTPFLVEPGGQVDQPDERLTKEIFDSYPNPQPDIYADLVVGSAGVTKSAAVFVVQENGYDPRTWKVLLGQPVTLRASDPPPAPFAPETGAASTAQAADAPETPIVCSQ